MAITKMTTQKIIGDHGSLRAYAEKRGISEGSLRSLLSTLGASSRVIEDQLEKDGYTEFLRIDRKEMLDELNNNQAEAVNGL